MDSVFAVVGDTVAFNLRRCAININPVLVVIYIIAFYDSAVAAGSICINP